MEPLRHFYEGERKVLLMFETRLQGRHSSWQAPAAVACFILAIVASIAGSVLTTAWILNAQQHPALYAVGVILLVLALPMLILGGHCLDLRDRELEGSNTAYLFSWSEFRYGEREIAHVRSGLVILLPVRHIVSAIQPTRERGKMGLRWRR
jgi:hypothetical protein